MRTLPNLKSAHMSRHTRHEEFVIIRTSSAMRTRHQLVIIGAIMGIVPLGLLIVFSQVTELGEYDFGAVYRLGAMVIIIHMILCVSFAVFQWSRLQRISDLWAWAGTTGAMAVIYCGVALRVDGKFLGAGEMLIVLGVTIGSAIVHAGLATAVWYAVVWRKGLRGIRVVVQEATYCASCGFDLSGKQSMACPSCGIAFTLKDLRTPEGLSDRAAAQRRET